MPVIRVDDINDPRLDDYRNVSDAELIRRRGLFVGEGRLVVKRLVAGPFSIVSLLVNQPSLDSLRTEGAPIESLPVYLCASEQLASIVGFNLHRGCLALVTRPAERTLEAIIAAATSLLILENLTDADNIGSAFRNAAAFGVSGVLLHACCDPLYRKSVRTSMGAVLRIPYARASAWPSDISRMKEAGFTVIALTPRADAESISAVSGGIARSGKVALLAGNETAGLSSEALALADRRVCIPMCGDIDSINVATAIGIALHRLMP